MLQPGQVVDRYTVEAEIGAGGMAHVFRVRHTTLGTLHALKVLKVQSAQIRQRLVQEGKLQASIRHANIVAVTDVLDVDGAPGLLMEYIDGPSLDVWLDRLAADGQAPTVREAERIFRGIVAGVARAHKHGLVHRDLKPGNVLLEENDGVLVPKVADFGLAKILLDDSGPSATRSGVAMGTPAYMSPEQIRDAKNVDQRTDIFALGCIFYELVAGASPFDGPDVLSIFSALAEGRYTPVEEVVPALPVHLQRTIRASLSANRDLRPSDCAAILSMLDGAEAGSAPPSGDFLGRVAAAPALGPTGAVSVSAPTHRSLRPGDTSGGKRESGGATWAVGASIAPDLSLDASRPDRPAPRAQPVSLDPGARSGGAPRRSGPRWLLVALVGAVGGGLLVAAIAVAVVIGMSTPAPVEQAPVAPSLLIVNTKKPAKGATVLVPVDTGVVKTAGDAQSIALVGPDGRKAQPGDAVPVGTWQAMASFADGSRGNASVKVQAGRTVTLTCSAATKSCTTGDD